MRLRALLTLAVCLFFARTSTAACTFSFLSEVTYPAGTNPADVASGDFNHDGRDDLAIMNRQSSNIAILLGAQGGTFGSPSFVSTGGASQADILAAFINNDEHLDLVAMGGTTPPSYTGTYVQVLLGNGSGGFTLGDNELVGFYPDKLAAGDFDNDNDTDIAVTFNDKFNLLLNNGAGVLTQKSINNATGVAGGIAAGDFDGDGKLDVVTTDWINDQVWTFFGAGDGTFTRSATAIATGTGLYQVPFAVGSGDFNGDGFDDIAVGNRDPYGAGSVPMSVILSNGEPRTFATPVEYGDMNGSGSDDLTLADMNGDGNPDVIIGASSSVHVFLGAGNGTFDDGDPGYGSGGLGLAILDVDDDGGPDVAATHFGAGTVGILQNVCGQVTLNLNSSANPVSHGNSVTITASLTSNPAATGTLTLSRTGFGSVASTSLSSATSVSATETLPIGTYEYVATYSGDSRFPAATRTLTQVVQIAPFGPPPGLVATSTGGGSVNVTWFATSGTAKYEVWRNLAGGGFAKIGETTNTFLVDVPSPSSAALYKVRAVSPADALSDFSNSDLTITHSFTDETITAGTTLVKAAHLTEVRDAANAVRALAELSAATWTSSTTVLAVQFNEVRTAINQARLAMGLSAATFTDTISTGVLVKRIHMVELRSAMR